MREAIGQTFLFNLVITLVGVMIFVLIGATAYSKTYRIKTKIVDIMEKYKGHENVYDEAKYEISEYLYSIGYRRNKNATQKCPDPKKNVLDKNDDFHSDSSYKRLNEQSENFHYCVYEFDSGVGLNRGKYYGVLVYIYFDFPIIGDLLEIPVYGETEVFFDTGYIEG